MRALIAAIIAVFALSACTIQVEPEPTKDKPSPSATSEAPQEDIDEMFVEVIRAEGIGYGDSDASLVELANLTCTALDEASVQDVAMVMMDAGFEPYDAGFFMGAAVEAYCPEHTSKMQDFSNSMGDAA